MTTIVQMHRLSTETNTESSSGRSLREDTRAVTPLIGFILLFGIAVVAFAGYQATTVPEQNLQTEFQHHQDVQDDMIDVRSGILSAAEGSDTFRSIKLGTTYRDRIFAVNPSNPAGTIETSDPYPVLVTDGDSLAPIGAPISDRFDTEKDPITRLLTYENQYREFEAGPITYDNSLVYQDDRDRGGNIVERAEPRIVRDEEVQIGTLQNEFSRSGIDRANIDLIGESAEFQDDGNTDSANVWLPTKIDTENAELWEDEFTDSDLVQFNGITEDYFDPGVHRLEVIVQDVDALNLGTVGVNGAPDDSVDELDPEPRLANLDIDNQGPTAVIDSGIENIDVDVDVLSLGSQAEDPHVVTLQIGEDEGIEETVEANSPEFGQFEPVSFSDVDVGDLDGDETYNVTVSIDDETDAITGELGILPEEESPVDIKIGDLNNNQDGQTQIFTFSNLNEALEEGDDNEALEEGDEIVVDLSGIPQSEIDYSIPPGQGPDNAELVRDGQSAGAQVTSIIYTIDEEEGDEVTIELDQVDVTDAEDGYTVPVDIAGTLTEGSFNVIQLFNAELDDKGFAKEGIYDGENHVSDDLSELDGSSDTGEQLNALSTESEIEEVDIDDEYAGFNLEGTGELVIEDRLRVNDVTGDVQLYAGDNINIEDGDIEITDKVEGDVRIYTGGDLDLNENDIDVEDIDEDVEIRAEGDVDADNIDISDVGGSVQITAGENIDVDNNIDIEDIDEDVEIRAEGDVDADNIDISDVGGSVQITAGENIDVDNNIDIEDIDGDVEIEAEGNIDAENIDISTGDSDEISGDIHVGAGNNIHAEDIDISPGDSGEIGGDVEIHAEGDINADNIDISDVDGSVQITVGDMIDTDGDMTIDNIEENVDIRAGSSIEVGEDGGRGDVTLGSNDPIDGDISVTAGKDIRAGVDVGEFTGDLAIGADSEIATGDQGISVTPDEKDTGTISIEAAEIGGEKIEVDVDEDVTTDEVLIESTGDIIPEEITVSDINDDLQIQASGDIDSDIEIEGNAPVRGDVSIIAEEKITNTDGDITIEDVTGEVTIVSEDEIDADDITIEDITDQINLFVENELILDGELEITDSSDADLHVYIGVGTDDDDIGETDVANVFLYYDDSDADPKYDGFDDPEPEDQNRDDFPVAIG
ncbi:hypothetical protein K0C01_02985 [Salinarchaeum sp. IM2453]|uniref:hypothetical protein n=1 Tax=Salinarchaeum sp. IM2453 TaxID=2862870 RepID=UPI001C83C2B3|nr:hypothetical protein [Salinarchaeum sp. IM2453]QZA89134.1 hypothetical protein K0C01_02985 [Salinarchaeum sp. IM2453]